jgi:uncharacterized membrane protein
VATVTAKGRLRDERGLMGKIAFVWIVLLALFVVAAIDTGSIAVARFKIANAADKAAFQAASEYKDTHDRAKAFAAAQQVVAEEAPRAKLPLSGFSIDPRTGDATVRVVGRAWSLVAGRLSSTRHYTKVTATSTSQPPTL